jgi:hypothetical protein
MLWPSADRPSRHRTLSESNRGAMNAFIKPRGLHRALTLDTPAYKTSAQLVGTVEFWVNRPAARRCYGARLSQRNRLILLSEVADLPECRSLGGRTHSATSGSATLRVTIPTLRALPYPGINHNTARLVFFHCRGMMRSMIGLGILRVLSSGALSFGAAKISSRPRECPGPLAVESEERFRRIRALLVNIWRRRRAQWSQRQPIFLWVLKSRR